MTKIYFQHRPIRIVQETVTRNGMPRRFFGNLDRVVPIKGIKSPHRGHVFGFLKHSIEMEQINETSIMGGATHVTTTFYTTWLIGHWPTFLYELAR